MSELERRTETDTITDTIRTTIDSEIDSVTVDNLTSQIQQLQLQINKTPVLIQGPLTKEELNNANYRKMGFNQTKTSIHNQINDKNSDHNSKIIGYNPNNINYGKNPTILSDKNTESNYDNYDQSKNINSDENNSSYKSSYNLRKYTQQQIIPQQNLYVKNWKTNDRVLVKSKKHYKEGIIAKIYDDG